MHCQYQGGRVFTDRSRDPFCFLSANSETLLSDTNKQVDNPEKAKEICSEFRKRGINVSYEDNQSIGKRYAKHDEIGTPYCITVDNQSLEDGQVTIRDRDTTEQSRIPIEKALKIVQEKIEIS